jgi:ribonucleotide reductase beta subunit family protein with ferritin-like domain
VVTTKINSSNNFLDKKTALTSLKMVVNYDNKEPILNGDEQLGYFPIRYNRIQEMYKRQKKCFWDVDEIDMSHDKDHFKKLNFNEQHFIKNILGFFATADAVVVDNICDNFIEDVKDRTIKTLYQYQAMMENIHAEMYGILINEIIDNEQEKQELFDAVKTVPCIQSKNAWSLKWAYSGAPFRQRVVANAIVEAVFFQGSFCAVYWIKERNIMPGLTQSNELIARDEGMHCETAYILYSYLLYPMEESEIHEMVNDAVLVEKEFINDSLKCDMIGMNPILMSQYIEYIADNLLVEFGYNRLYDSKNPFAFMENINLDIKGNFFEVRNTSYKRAETTQGKITVDEDF